jgi:hypothetical protein
MNKDNHQNNNNYNCNTRGEFESNISFLEVTLGDVYGWAGQVYVVKITNYNDKFKTKDYEVFHKPKLPNGEEVPDVLDPPVPLGEAVTDFHIEEKIIEIAKAYYKI